MTLRKKFSHSALSVLQLERGKKRKEENNKPKRTDRMRVKTERKKKEERNRFLIFVN
jgi:hypothetical protein